MDENAGSETVERAVANFGSLPEEIGPGDLVSINAALSTMFEMLEQAEADWHAGNQRDAAGTAVWALVLFIMRFQAVVYRSPQLPLIRLASALRELDKGHVEPLLAPAPTQKGGRTADTTARQSLVGTAVGTVRCLEWTGLRPRDAQRAVADVLDKLEIKPGRGRPDNGAHSARVVRAGRRRCGWAFQVGMDRKIPGFSGSRGENQIDAG